MGGQWGASKLGKKAPRGRKAGKEDPAEPQVRKMGEFKCPVPECKYEPFQTEAGLKSHLRTKHPDFTQGELGGAREVPIVEEDFATLLKKFKIRADLAANIAENISHTGGPKAFEDAEILLKRLSLWSSDIPTARRKNIMDQWFAERGVDIPFEVQQKAGMTTEQIQETEKKTREAEKEAGVEYIYDIDAHLVRMAKVGERWVTGSGEGVKENVRER